MRRSVLANLNDLDPQTRDAAEAAARKAGLRLEDWVSEILADRLAHEPFIPSQPPRPGVDELDTFIDRMMQPRRPTKTDVSHESRSHESQIGRAHV